MNEACFASYCDLRVDVIQSADYTVRTGRSVKSSL